MAHFYGTMQGGRAEVSRTGHKTTGMQAHVRGWDLGVRAHMTHDRDGKDYAVVYLTSGSNGNNGEVCLGTFDADDLDTLRRDVNALQIMGKETDSC
jgi:hypothetical protein